MKQYTVEITNEALADMEQIYNHIAYALQAPENAMAQYNWIAKAIEELSMFPEKARMESEPENAMDQYNRIADAILTLDTLAERIHIMESVQERRREIRRLLVDNYSVFYVI